MPEEARERERAIGTGPHPGSLHDSQMLVAVVPAAGVALPLPSSHLPCGKNPLGTTTIPRGVT